MKIQMSKACRELAALIGKQSLAVAEMDLDGIAEEVDAVAQIIKHAVCQKKAAAAELLAIIAAETGWFVAEIESGIVGDGHEVCEPFRVACEEPPPAKPNGKPIRQFTHEQIASALISVYA